MSKQASTVVGIDLGNHSVKAVRLQKKGAQYVLARVANIPANRESATGALVTEDTIATLLKQAASLVKVSGADVHFTINATNSTVRYVELPQIHLDEMRTALKLNSTTYLRQNFENYTFDACPLDQAAAAALSGKAAKGAHGKIKVLVGGIASSELVLYFHASRRAGMKPRSMQLAPISLINGFEAAYPEVFRTQAVALLDIGFLSSSLTILDKGAPLLTRSVPMGGKQITEYIAQMTSSDFPKAEAAKLKGETDVGDALTRTAVTLIREVRSSINFFEKNSDQPLSKVYLSGGSVRSAAVVEALSSDIGATCEPWNAAQGLSIELPAEQQEIFTQNQSSFAAALGAARTYTAAATTLAAAAPAIAPAAPSATATAVKPPKAA